jgi:hypothetical protein
MNLPKLEFAPGRHAEVVPEAVGHLDTFSTDDLIMLELREASLVQSRLVKNSALEKNLASRINWAAVAGLGLAAVVSVTMWACIAFALAHIWK